MSWPFSTYKVIYPKKTRDETSNPLEKLPAHFGILPVLFLWLIYFAKISFGLFSEVITWFALHLGK